MVTWRGTTVLMDGTCECVFNYQITSRAEKHIKVVYPTRLLGWVLEEDHGAVINGYGCIYDGHNNIVIICSHFPWLGFIYPWVVKEMKGHKQKETIKHSLISIINKMIFRGREILGSKHIILLFKYQWNNHPQEIRFSIIYLTLSPLLLFILQNS